MTTPRSLRVATVVLLALATSCGGGDDAPTWSRLATSSYPLTRYGAPALPDGSRIVEREGDTYVESSIASEAWKKLGATGEVAVWEARLPILVTGRARGETRLYSLAFDGGEPLTSENDVAAFGSAPDRFFVEGATIRVALRADGPAPSSSTLTTYAGQEALSDDGRRVVSGRRIGGEGLVVWPGTAVDVVCDVPPHSALRFETVREPAMLGKGARLAENTFRIRVEGAPQFEFVDAGGFETRTPHVVVLPPGGGKRVRLRFEVEGPFSYTAFLDPVVGPAEIGTYGKRPWEPPLDDVVFFLADTFRADNLALYGGTAGLAPNLDRFAESALAFRNAWSVSTHTLPTHSTFFSGVYPRQNGQVDFFNPLPEAVDTLAEMLSRVGYRTVAITDGIMVSQTHGMSQGFATFDERHSDLDGTLARVRASLDADDGRPLFLFVQSYATHAPFEIREATRERIGDLAVDDVDFDDVLASLAAVEENTQHLDMDAPGAEEAVRDIRRFYDASVCDLDDGFGSFLEELDARGLAGGWLLVTSDHGESIGEHDRVFHAGVTFEEVLRVPLLIRGPRVQPGVVERAVSLIDIAPTITDMAGTPPLSGWIGRSLLGEQPERPIYAFQCRGSSTDTTLAVIEDMRKLIGFEDRESYRVREWRHAFDLDSDPQELNDVLGEADWTRELSERLTPTFEPLLTPLVEAEEARLSAERLREMNGAGYFEGK